MFLRTNYLFAGSICVGNPYRSASALDIPWAVSLELGVGILVAAGVGLGMATCITLDARAPQASRNNAVRAIANPLRNTEHCAIKPRSPESYNDNDLKSSSDRKFHSLHPSTIQWRPQLFPFAEAQISNPEIVDAREV